MCEAGKYSAVETLPEGNRIEIRALQLDDRPLLLAAIDRSSAQSLYRRFFSPRRSFTEEEIAYFVDIDFVNHVALVATMAQERVSGIVGGGRYIVVSPRNAEVALAVVDGWQRHGVGAALMRHLIIIARSAGLEELSAEVMADNTSMLKVFEKSGLRRTTRHEAGIVHVTLKLN
jgi:GNAT superfamily N-acetyltransferase